MRILVSEGFRDDGFLKPTIADIAPDTARGAGAASQGVEPTQAVLPC